MQGQTDTHRIYSICLSPWLNQWWMQCFSFLFHRTFPRPHDSSLAPYPNHKLYLQWLLQIVLYISFFINHVLKVVAWLIQKKENNTFLVSFSCLCRNSPPFVITALSRTNTNMMTILGGLQNFYWCTTLEWNGWHHRLISCPYQYYSRLAVSFSWQFKIIKGKKTSQGMPYTWRILTLWSPHTHTHTHTHSQTPDCTLYVLCCVVT